MTDKQQMPEEMQTHLRETVEQVIRDGNHFILVQVTDENKVLVMASTDDPMFRAQIAMALLSAKEVGG